jgi:hypothetical protein
LFVKSAAPGDNLSRDISDKEKIFRDQIGQKATVERHDIPKEKTERLNRMLCDLGLAMVEVDPVLKHFSYQGSAAIHVFTSEILASQIYLPQVQPFALYRCPQPVANAAIQELDRKARELYGFKKGKLRSGW